MRFADDGISVVYQLQNNQMFGVLMTRFNLEFQKYLFYDLLLSDYELLLNSKISNEFSGSLKPLVNPLTT